MTCLEIEARLDDLLEGTLPPGERRGLESHLAACDRCRDLVAAARGGREPAGPAVDLAEAVLRRTTGPACGRAESMLVDLADGLLAAGDLDLVEAHVAHCAACAALARSIVEGREVLPSLAEVDPGSWFAATVIGRTTGPACGRAESMLVDLADGLLATGDRDLIQAHLERCAGCGELARAIAGSRDVLPSLAEADPGPWFTAAVLRRTTGRAGRPGRLRAFRADLVARPRLAAEAAYVGAFVLFLLFGTPVSPLRGVPALALDAARTNPVRVVQAGLAPLPPMLADYGDRAWEATAGRVLERALPTRKALADRVTAAWSVMSSLHGHGRQVWTALLEGNFEEVQARLSEMGDDLKTIWTRLTGLAPSGDDASGPVEGEV
jgi:anti-sigma factor RsiW